jgi:dGTPase
MGNLWSKSRRGVPGDASSSHEDPDDRGVRSVFQQDYDRLLFSTPVRRLADKTQVWPMDENDGVRTRLTHSHEVANLARSIGTRVFRAKPKSFIGVDLGDTIQPILSAIGLGHDLGNPPFGHQGEASVGRWFARRQGWIFTKVNEDKASSKLDEVVAKDLRAEFTEFDGNPQSLRLMTRLQTHHERLGLDLTAATLAASIKYPVCFSKRDKDRAQSKKGGYFESERDVVDWVREETGLKEGQRHPLTWIMEACDDIAYSVLDVDDLLKKGVLSPDDVLVILQHYPRTQDQTQYHKTVSRLQKKFEEVNRRSDRRAEIRHDVKIQFLRAYTIEALIGEATDAFVQHIDSIMGLTHARALMEENFLCDVLKDVARRYGFRHPSVLKTEAQGAAALNGLMSALWEAIVDRKKLDDLWSDRRGARARYVFSMISPNYIEAAVEASRSKGAASGLRYRELRLLTDMVSGMTDTFAMKLWRELEAIPDAGRA